MAKAGRLDARLTFTANQTGTYTDSAGGPLGWTVAAGNYYPWELVAALQASIIALAGTVGNTFTAAISDGEGGTGRVTLNATATPWSLTWTTTAIRDALGFSANITAVSASQTGTHARGLWLPGNPAKMSMYGDSATGSIITDLRATKGPKGHMDTVANNYHYQHEGVSWTGVPAARAMSHHESVTNESFQSFFLDVAMGRVSSYIPVGTYVRLVWDADVDATYAVGRLAWPPRFSLPTRVSGWTGQYNVALPPLNVEG